VLVARFSYCSAPCCALWIEGDKIKDLEIIEIGAGVTSCKMGL
jgi:hypothetical protein